VKVNPEPFHLFFALLAIALVVLMLVISISALFDKSDNIGIRKAFKDLWIEGAAAIATTCVAGSLIMSEVLHHKPCTLCWIQRGFMYPAALLLLFESVRRTKWFQNLSTPKFLAGTRPTFAYTALGLASLGIWVSAFHRWEEQYPPKPENTFCDPVVPCSYRYVDVFGFITLPTMAGVGFLGIIFFVTAHILTHRSSQQKVSI
jgi:disulfide bond formation protein DsbB